MVLSSTRVYISASRCISTDDGLGAPLGSSSALGTKSVGELLESGLVPKDSAIPEVTTSPQSLIMFGA